MILYKKSNRSKRVELRSSFLLVSAKLLRISLFISKTRSILSRLKRSKRWPLKLQSCRLLLRRLMRSTRSLTESTELKLSNTTTKGENCMTR